MTLMQKAVTPQMSAAYLERGFDRVGGFVVRTPDVEHATTPAAVFEAHGLGFPGSPHRPDANHVDVLRFPATPQLRFENAVGGIDEESRARTGGTFIDRPPFTGTGFVATAEAVVPLYWLAHSRVPAGSQLVRLGADGTSRVLAEHVDVGHGWYSQTEQIGHAASPRISRHVGPMAMWSGTALNADVFADRVVVAAEVEPPAQYGFQPTGAGRWRREVPRDEVAELFEMYVAAKWNGLAVRVVDQWTAQDGESISHVSYTGHNADLAEGLQLPKVDAGVYEVTVPTASLVAVEHTQLVPEQWAAPARA
ncbi:hypothetical protein [Georgenia sunbinii]|uniref:hypothetical protein n=1 Tax=Georgenia sunbinii TaxID=3117728 RepID=UPI002F26CCB0